MCVLELGGGPDKLVKFSVVMALTLKLKCLRCPHFLSSSFIVLVDRESVTESVSLSRLIVLTRTCNEALWWSK